MQLMRCGDLREVVIESEYISRRMDLIPSDRMGLSGLIDALMTLMAHGICVDMRSALYTAPNPPLAIRWSSLYWVESF